MAVLSASRRMKLLVDENVPDSVTQFLADRGHEILLVRDVLPAQTSDPVIAVIGDRLSAIVVSWDDDFKNLVQRVSHGNRTKFRNLGRITFKCKETQGLAQARRWIEQIELHYEQCSAQPDLRMIAEIQGGALKLF